MFRSQSENKQLNYVISEEFKEYLLPKDVVKTVNDQRINLDKARIHIEIEKKRIDAEIQDISNYLSTLINKKKYDLYSYFDKYMEVYNENYNLLQFKVKDYKSQAFKRPNSNNFKSNPSISIKDLKYYSNDQKLKEEKNPFSSKIPINKLSQEVKKRELLFLSNELNKQLNHLPLFNHSENSQSFLKDLKSTMYSEIDQLMMSLNKLIYEAPQIPFHSIHLNPAFSSVITDRHNIISGLSNISLQEIDKVTTGHKDQILSMVLLDEKTLITGSNDGEVRIWDPSIHRFKGSFMINEPISFMGVLQDDDGKLMNNSMKKRYLIINGYNNSIDVWDIDQKRILKSFRGHRGQVNSIIYMKESQTLISVSKDKEIMFWDINNCHVIQRIEESVNCLWLQREKTRFISGGNDCYIKLWKLEFTKNYYRFQISVNAELEFKLLDKAPIITINQGSLDENILIVGKDDGSISLWDMKQRNIRKEWKFNSGLIKRIILFEDGWKEGNSLVKNNDKQSKNEGLMKFEGGNLLIGKECMEIIKRGDELEVICAKEKALLFWKIE